MNASLQQTFRALADPTRRDILMMLSSNDLSIAQVAQNFEMTRAAIKKHLTALHDGGLIDVQTIGRTKVNSINSDGLKPIMDWLKYFDLFWDDHLDALKTAIEKETQHD